MLKLFLEGNTAALEMGLIMRVLLGQKRDTLEGPRGDCKAYQKCIGTIFDNFGGKINQKMVVSNSLIVEKIIIVIIKSSE